MARGHYAYYGISGNIRRLQGYGRALVRIWKKWLSRRARNGVVRWRQMNALLKRHPLPSARIVHRYTALSEARS